MRSIVSSVKKGSKLTLTAVVSSESEDLSHGALERCDAVFINREIKEARLIGALETIREYPLEIPVVLTYEAEPDGKAYLLANRYECLLFSEMDRLKRALTPADIGEALREKTLDDMTRRLMGISLCSGPCSTG
jgi:hypothetical protein